MVRRKVRELPLPACIAVHMREGRKASYVCRMMFAFDHGSLYPRCTDSRGAGYRDMGYFLRESPRSVGRKRLPVHALHIGQLACPLAV